MWPHSCIGAQGKGRAPSALGNVDRKPAVSQGASLPTHLELTLSCVGAASVLQPHCAEVLRYLQSAKICRSCPYVFLGACVSFCGFVLVG